MTQQYQWNLQVFNSQCIHNAWYAVPMPVLSETMSKMQGHAPVAIACIAWQEGGALIYGRDCTSAHIVSTPPEVPTQPPPTVAQPSPSYSTTTVPFGTPQGGESAAQVRTPGYEHLERLRTQQTGRERSTARRW